MASDQKKKESRKVRRAKLGQPLEVIVGSIGAEVRYNLQTRDVSYNGFFLDFEKPGRFPFTPSSIMEIWIQLGDGNSIFFNGKMARVVYPNDSNVADTGPGIGVRIVQIEIEEEEKLKQLVDSKFDESQDNSADVA